MSTPMFETAAGRRHERKQNHVLDEVNEGLFWIGMRAHAVDKEANRLLEDLKRFSKREPNANL